MIEEVGYSLVLPHQAQQLLQAADALRVEVVLALDDLSDEGLVCSAIQDRAAELHTIIVDPVDQLQAILGPYLTVLESPRHQLGNTKDPLQFLFLQRVI